MHVEPGEGKASEVYPASLAAWHRRFTRALRMPAALASFLSTNLDLATSSEPAAEIALWLTAHGSSLRELVDVDGFTVVPGSQPSWFTGLAAADRQGQDDRSLARTWVGELCDSMRLDSYETILRSLNDG